MSRQSANKLLMVRPAAFAYNNETAGSNTFQKTATLSHQAVHELALKEFDAAVQKLRKHDIDVFVVTDTATPQKPDAVFPNNCFSVHDDSVVLYPMLASNRRYERNVLLKEIKKRFPEKQLLDLTPYESSNRFLEGTGSLVLDRVNRIAFACRSERTDNGLVGEWCERMNYKPVLFNAHFNHQPVYHTNVVMSIGEKISVCCFDAIDDDHEKQTVMSHLSTHRNVVPISASQMESFAGNLLLVRSTSDVPYWILSQSALRSLRADQIRMLEQDGNLLPLSLDVIETFGGGSARCMLAEVGW